MPTVTPLLLAVRTLTYGLLLSLLAGCAGEANDLALGTLERDRIILRATASEIIVDQPRQEGRPVKRGDLLVQLDDRNQRAVVARAQAEVARAAARMEELRNGARKEDIAAASARASGAQATLVEAEANYQRARRLLAQNLAAQATVDTALATRDAAEASLESAREELLRLTNGTRPEQLEQGRAELEATRAQLALEQRHLEELSVTATRDALLDSLPWNVGERVPQGSTLAIMLADSRPFARVYVPEIHRAHLRVGMEVPVHVDGIDGALTGQLRWVATDPAFTPYYALNASDRSRLVYMAEFDLLDGDGLPTGVPVQVDLGHD
ncbi:HlyD family secretion protein [Parahaliea mediterranea]|uniref:HlyD family efflux transporter periplasmic adaptor subunit n=1 Tax=Parahaliea mediterranea TaxID=651086 RepID=A0A939DE05_9GAMM|nr:HlyD family efflux transporter periplasmic adaptor subunit [Parahaliea mediterranea]MBN7796375.1 HlyD family efflux transporter periplasmic adaptor subunit [Parahaliea mediterranea]